MPIQHKHPPVLHFNDFASWDYIFFDNVVENGHFANFYDFEKKVEFNKTQSLFREKLIILKNVFISEYLLFDRAYISMSNKDHFYYNLIFMGTVLQSSQSSKFQKNQGGGVYF